jgi:hypothetical protein
MVRWFVVFVAITMGVLGPSLVLVVALGYAPLVATLSSLAAVICYVADCISDTVVGEKTVAVLQQLVDFSEAVLDFIFGGR